MQSTLSNYPWCKETDKEVRALGLPYDEELMLGLLWDVAFHEEQELLRAGVTHPCETLVKLRRRGWDVTSQATGPSKKMYFLNNKTKRWKN